MSKAYQCDACGNFFKNKDSQEFLKEDHADCDKTDTYVVGFTFQKVRECDGNDFYDELDLCPGCITEKLHDAVQSRVHKGKTNAPSKT